MSYKNRRDFLKTTTAAGLGVWVAGGIGEASAAQPQRQGANERLNIAIVGAGGRGANNLGAVAGSENIVALCDPDQNRARGSFNRYPKVPKYDDFRVMLEKQGKEIDAVVVSTPDHTHAPASMMAMRMGKHVYCEKPLTHSVYEARMMRQMAAKMKVATQMGNQGTSFNNFRTGVEVVRSGALGDVREVHIWTNRPGDWWNQGMAARPKARPPVPKTLNWDVWLGPAEERPYHPDYLPFSWRGWWDFGTGAVGDMGCHTANLPYMALELGAPSTVMAEVDGRVTEHSPPNGCRITFEVPARGKSPACTVYWYEVRRPPRELFMGEDISGSGSLMIGSRGTMYSSDDYGNRWALLPQNRFENFENPKPTLPRSPGHHQEWIRACKGGQPAMSNFDYAGPLAEFILLGNVAMRVGKRIQWDAQNMRARGLDAATQYIRREYRKGWSL